MERDISSDPAHVHEFRSIQQGASEQCLCGAFRDISSDLVDGSAKGALSSTSRDISSVTGSAAQALLDEYDFGVLPENAHADLKARIAAIQRKAVDAFVRDELPGLLAQAYDEWLDEKEIDTGNRPPLAWVAERIKKEVEQRAQTS